MRYGSKKSVIPERRQETWRDRDMSISIDCDIMKPVWLLEKEK